MWRRLRAAPALGGRTSAAPGEDARVITAKYNIADRRDPRTGSRLFFACRVEHITPMQIAVSVPVTGDIGDPVLVRVDGLGEVKGSIEKRTRAGFVITISATPVERAKFKVKIDWFEKIRGRKVVNKRLHDRFTPANQLSTLIFGDGSTLRCFVVDMSSSGAAISANVTLEAGTPLALGKVVGRVVRHLPNGFAIRFVSTVDVKVLEDLLIKPSI
jgi:hypothetical protein